MILTDVYKDEIKNTLYKVWPPGKIVCKRKKKKLQQIECTHWKAVCWEH